MLKKTSQVLTLKTVSSHFHMLVRPMLLHLMALVSVRLFCKNLGNLQEFFGQMVYRPPWQKLARTPMTQETINALSSSLSCDPFNEKLRDTTWTIPEMERDSARLKHIGRHPHQFLFPKRGADQGTLSTKFTALACHSQCYLVRA